MGPGTDSFRGGRTIDLRQDKLPLLESKAYNVKVDQASRIGGILLIEEIRYEHDFLGSR